MTNGTYPPFGHPQARFDHLAALTSSRIRSGYLRIPCPAHGGTDPNLALWVNDGGIAARCHSAGCAYADIAMAIETRYGISIGPGPRQHHAPMVTVRPRDSKRTSSSTSRDLRPYALQLWHRSISFPNTPDHPARQWLAARQLWRPELPLPSSVRWIGTEHLHQDYAGAGAVIAMAASPATWLAAWPSLPEPSSVQLVYVDAHGSPAMDRNLNKRTYASVRDAVIVLGCPFLENAAAPVDVAEGLADALALASRSPAPAVATLGTSGMTSTELATWLATSPATRGLGGPRPGQERTGPTWPAPRAPAGAPSQQRRRKCPGGPPTSSPQGPRSCSYSARFQQTGFNLDRLRQDLEGVDRLATLGMRQAGSGHVRGGMMTIHGDPVPPEGLDHIRAVREWILENPNDLEVQRELHEMHRDPRFAEPDEPDDIMPEIPALTDFPVPPGLKKYVDAVRTVAGASIPTSARLRNRGIQLARR